MEHSIITYPEPPPTCNVLTSNQREQLRRTTQKLTKVLGSTPQLIDCNYAVHVQFPMQKRLVCRTSRKSLRSTQKASISSPSRSPGHCPSPSSASSISTTSNSSAFSQCSASPDESLAHYAASRRPRPSCDGRRKPPMLRLAVDSPDILPFGSADRPSFDTSPSSSLSSSSSSPHSYSPPSTANSSFSSNSSTDHLLAASSPLSRSYTISIPRNRRASSLFLLQGDEHQFRVSSEASTRRKKMERIRKKLGECVPVEAVFPENDENETDEALDFVVVDRHRSNFAAKSTSLEAVFESPDEHGGEGLDSGLRYAPHHSEKVTKSWGRWMFKSIRKSNL